MTEVTFRKHVAPVVVIVLLWCFCSTVGAADPDERPITVVFRYDDYQDKSPTTLELKLIDAFQTRHIQCTFGVVPCFAYVPLSAEKAELLRKAADAGAIEIAQHGFTHGILVPKPHGLESEFEGIAYQEQERRISRGKALLEERTGRKIKIFIPPWNRYDLNTFRVLEKLGFECLSSDQAGEVLESSRLKMLPVTGGLQVSHAVELARKYWQGRSVVIIALFHSFDFAEVDKVRGHVTFAEFEGILDWVTSQKDVQVLSIGQACERLSDLGAHRFLKNKVVWEWRFLVPSRLDRLYSRNVYFEAEALDSVRTKLFFFYMGVAAVSGVIAFLTAWVTFPRSTLWKRVVSYGAPALLLLCLVYSFRHLLPSYRGLMGDCVLLGACVGIWLYRFRRHRQEAAD